MNWRIKEISFFSVAFSSISILIGFQAWRIMFNNFAVETFDASPTDIGLIQAAREIPGLLAFGVGALALYITESKIAAISIVTLGIGVILCGLAPSLLVLGFATVLLSFGFHYFEPTNSSQLLMLAKNSEVGRFQGRLRPYESLAGFFIALLIMGLTIFLDYRLTFYIIGGLVSLIGIYLIFALPSNRGKAEVRKIKIKKEYWLYYVLSFLRGCRRHIFTTFAIYLLVKNHELNITAISAIMLTNNFITFFTFRMLGKISDSWGEKAILAGSSFLLVLIFTGYAYIDFLPLLIGFYLVDNVLFGSSIALRSYLRKISTDEDITGCLSFGMTANHITAVIIPITGGIIWTKFGFETTFLAGAVIVFIDMIFSLMIPSKKKSDQSA